MDTICILSNAHGYGGAEKSMELIVQKLIETYKVIIYVENDQHRDAFLAMQSKNLEVISLEKGKSIINTFTNIVKIREIFMRKDIIAILVNTNKGAFYLAILSLFGYTSVKNTLVYIRDFQWKCLHFIMWSLRNSKILLPSQALLDKKNYIEKYMNPEKIYIVGDPVNINSKFGEYSSNYILTLANIAQWKGLIYLLKAYHQSRLFESGIQLRIYGSVADSEYYHALINYIRRHDLTNFIFISPFINDVDMVYDGCLFVVNSSISDFGGPETFGRTIIEAWSHKKAVISFNVGGPKYLIDAGNDGILIEEKNIKELSEGMSMLVTNQYLSKMMGLNGFQKVINCYCIDRIVEKLKKLFL
jgi:glycosyltransferase involved in cell wall biosynthesis